MTGAVSFKKKFEEVEQELIENCATENCKLLGWKAPTIRQQEQQSVESQCAREASGQLRALFETFQK